MIIAVDFDGTLCCDAYPSIGVPMTGAVQGMQDLKAMGCYIIIWTCRSGKLLLDAINWLKEQGIPFDRVNDHCPENVKKYGEGGMKVYADVYIDDRNIGGFVGWATAVKQVQDLKDALEQE